MVGGVYLFMQFRPAINPALGPAAYDIVEEIDRYEAQLPGENNTGFPLQIPNGTRVNIFADELNNARFMAFDSNGVLYLSQPKEEGLWHCQTLTMMALQIRLLLHCKGWIVRME